ncbi:lipopolysaccharide biosynthesis protein [Kaistella flava (ex Peng et al. 2021)]|uniref:Lipopolysaccharide biosynthesis protein n=1 Tax=Kaistella flava (ex Peng et al. 2021) TaxID=2038776 RepID=A0A7M2Y735_9FLAO|nr:lipopolysaccharide biosynthesis protein [Kaistella flava (ex Peng et al. 2021)]QOW09232.1 lipopolysaccharide biosynthesis protein [Kaistella flava (ex Peng et al. 2021)]
MNLEGKKILFLSANFFGYEKAIVNRLRELGAEVDFYNERPSDSVLSKGIIRVNKNFYFKKIKSYYQKILNETGNQNYDFFLLIKGETIPFSFLRKFKEHHPSAKMIFYSYDTVQEYPKFLKLYSYFDKNFTFEPKDAQHYNLHFRPLFFLNDYQNSTTDSSIKYDVVFIGSAHTDRYLIGEKIKEIGEIKNLKTYFYYYAQSKAAFRLKKIFDQNLKKFDTKKLSFKKLKHSEIASIYAQSRSVLDINKPFQFGLSMRTFETLASGKKLLTTNSDIKNYPFYNEDNIMTLDRDNLDVNAEFFESDFKEISTKNLEMMSLDSWIACLFFKDQDEYWKKYHSVFQSNK